MVVQSAWSLLSLALLGLDSMITTNSTVSNNWWASIFIGDAVSTQTFVMVIPFSIHFLDLEVLT